jgi:multiple sugar transport system substrate-binding protein
MTMIELRGVSWDHPRGHNPMVATAEAYMREHPDVQIAWDTRSLQDFADYPIVRLAERYDLMVIDHPHVGIAADDGCLVPLDEYLDASFLAEQAANSVGPSHESYFYAGHQWTLATDAAAQVSAYRADVLHQIGATVPRTWDDVLALANIRRDQPYGRVAMPMIPVDCISAFCSLCANAGELPYLTDEVAVSRPVGRYALETLRALREAAHSESLTWNPPRTLDRMSTTDEIAYVPLLFGYSNYSRAGFRPHLVRFIDVPATGEGGPRGAILGGAGVAVSSRSRQIDAACAYAAYVASPEVQRGIYFDADGQPGHRTAWTDDRTNAVAHDFFRDTLATLDGSYLRPRYAGYIDVQDRAGEIIHEFLRTEADVNAALDALDELYRQSKRS